MELAVLRRRVEQTTSLDERLADHLRQTEEKAKNIVLQDGATVEHMMELRQ